VVPGTKAVSVDAYTDKMRRGLHRHYGHGSWELADRQALSMRSDVLRLRWLEGRVTELSREDMAEVLELRARLGALEELAGGGLRSVAKQRDRRYRPQLSRLAEHEACSRCAACAESGHSSSS